MAYPSGGPATFLSLGGDCPSTHPVRIPQLMYEVVWDTTPFNDPSDWPTDGSQPFYLSTGDNTGLGQHADYVFGWKGDALQKAMDTSGCMGAKCASLKTQAVDAGTKCSVKRTVDEDHDGCEILPLPPPCSFLEKTVLLRMIRKSADQTYNRAQGTPRHDNADGDVKRGCLMLSFSYCALPSIPIG